MKVFIDGAAGTTGLRLYDRLRDRADIELLTIDPDLRKDAAERARIANAADVVFLCLPDAAATEAAALITNPDTRVIDASTAHRTSDTWVYGLPELSAEHRAAIAAAKRVSNPGCYATGFIALACPLVSAGVAAADFPFTCHAVSGYSGAGKPMIEQYRDPNRERVYASPRQYALTQAHKHLPEMQKRSGLDFKPVFNPLIADYYAGMLVTVPLHTRLLKTPMGAKELHAFFSGFYAGQRAVRVMPFGAEGGYTAGMIDAEGLTGSDVLEIYVCGHDEQAVLISRLDNLGKGASGAAIQNMNIMCGLDEMTGLSLEPTL
ncbi:MAG: N-acetyl-gamma-glutamyl-phosphate reductase [Oscillospiraceae bacterium]|jgi:N-acetyl-gamma-glutamyl-phosphate reductase|nr:N-acetyl-gamma-glutamyl-phosphate reductase [Oscillospiraceae bacterium]